MKKEEVYVNVESKEKAQQYKSILEALGENVEGYEVEYFERLNARQLGPRSSGGWWLSMDYEKPCKINTTICQEITFGQLIDLLNEPKKIAVKVDLKESKILCKHLGVKHCLGDFTGEIAIYLNRKHEINTCSEICWDFVTNVRKDYQIILFSDFAKEHNIKLPLITSEDGVDLFEGDEYWPVYNHGNDNWKIEHNNACCLMHGVSCLTTPLNCKAFSTKQAALDWIESQKPKIIKIECNQGFVALVDKDFINWEGENPGKITRQTINNIYDAFLELNQ